MLENLLNLVKEHAGDSIVNNPAIPDQYNNAAIEETSAQIVNGLKSQVSSGNVSSLMGLLNNGGNNIASNPVVSQIVSSLTQSFASKFGINKDHAHSVASTLVPMVMSKLISKVNDPNDKSFDIQGMAKELGGGGFGGMIGGMFGKMF